MKRRLFNLLAAVSLVLCVATAVLWVRSHLVCDHLVFLPQAGGTLVSRSLRGELIGQRHHAPLNPQQAAMVRTYFSRPAAGLVWAARHTLPGEPGVRFDWEFMGFAAFSTAGGTPVPNAPSHAVQSPSGQLVMAQWSAQTEVSIPHWSLGVLFAVLPSVALCRLRMRRRRRASGRCESCGYDLRATPDRCPECGEVPSLPGVQYKD
jgi:hypothetical protein